MAMTSEALPWPCLQMQAARESVVEWLDSHAEAGARQQEILDNVRRWMSDASKSGKHHWD